MACIIGKGLSLGYDGKKMVTNLNFEINKGDYLCIVGENGAGKRTLIKTLLHLQEAIEGEIIIGEGLKAYEIGYLPQQTVVQKDFPATVWEVVLSGTLSHLGRKWFYGKREKELAKEKLKELGMWELRIEHSSQKLPQPFRRSTAKDTTCKSFMCNNESYSFR